MNLDLLQILKMVSMEQTQETSILMAMDSQMVKNIGDGLLNLLILIVTI